jgi:biopolymer transport protein ExbB
MSVGSWFIIITRVISLYQVKPLLKEIALFWQKTSWQDGLNSFTQQSNNPFYQLAARAHMIMQERQMGANQTQSLPLANQIETDDWLSSNLKAELDLIIASLQKGLAFLASTGATAPFIGLFGTVWGIYHALMTIGSSGSASIDQVAGPIGEALVMTGLGLAVAIPAVLGYNALSKANRDLLISLRRFNDDLHTYLIQNERP